MERLGRPWRQQLTNGSQPWIWSTSGGAAVDELCTLEAIEALVGVYLYMYKDAVWLLEWGKSSAAEEKTTSDTYVAMLLFQYLTYDIEAIGIGLHFL